MDPIVFLEWAYEPTNYFEAEQTIKDSEFEVTIVGGRAIAKIAMEKYDAVPNMDRRLHRLLDAYFLGIQLETFKPYILSQPSLTRVDATGRRRHELHVIETVSVDALIIDAIHIDGAGNVLADTREDRAARRKVLSALACKYHDEPVFSSMHRSFRAAVDDRNHELVHLYEIRDALKKHFGTKKKACTAIGLPQKDWSRLGKLCNDAPVEQGRHRGKNLTGLRNAAREELDEARTISVRMIRGYMQYLECMSQRTGASRSTAAQET